MAVGKQISKYKKHLHLFFYGVNGDSSGVVPLFLCGG